MRRVILRASLALLTFMAAAPALADDLDVCKNPTEDKVAMCALAFNNRCGAYFNKGEFTRAIADCDQAIKLNPNVAAFYNNRCSAYNSKGDYARAVADCGRAIQLEPRAAVFYNNRCSAYKNKGEYDRAIADCSQAIKIDPKAAVFYNNRCTAYDDKGEHDRAIADCSQAIRIDPKAAVYYNNRGKAYSDKGDYERAIADFDQAVKLDPNFIIARQARDGAQAAFAARQEQEKPAAHASPRPEPEKQSAASRVPGQPTKRALVIGIDAYPNLVRAAQLERAVADAEAVGDKLASLGFQVTRLTSSQQGTLAGILRGFEDFKKTIAPDDMVVLFYAGHGMGLSDGTYLLPADVSEMSLEVESTARRAAINENELTDGLRQVRAGVVVAVIDACRNDLFTRAVRRGVGNERGLRPAETEGIFKIYSASEGQTALDRLPGGGDGSKNSVFTRVFLKAIGTPGLDLNRLGAMVRDEVHEIARTADHQQTPAVYDKLIGSTRVYFVPESTAADMRVK